MSIQRPLNLHSPQGGISLQPDRLLCMPRRQESRDLILRLIRQSILCHHPLEPAPAFLQRLGSVPSQFAPAAKCRSRSWSGVSFLGLRPPSGTPPAWCAVGGSIAGVSAQLGRLAMRSKDPDAERSSIQRPKAMFLWGCCGVGIAGM